MENPNYEEALKRLEQIAQDMESGKFTIDQLADRLKEAKNLITLCKQRLTKTDAELQKILKQVDA